MVYVGLFELPQETYFHKIRLITLIYLYRCVCVRVFVLEGGICVQFVALCLLHTVSCPPLRLFEYTILLPSLTYCEFAVLPFKC